MKTILTVARKELLDLFRDRRTVMIALLPAMPTCGGMLLW